MRSENMDKIQETIIYTKYVTHILRKIYIQKWVKNIKEHKNRKNIQCKYTKYKSTKYTGKYF